MNASPTRRAVLVGACTTCAVGAVAACGGSSSGAAPTAAPAPGTPLGAAADVPVGGGTVFRDQGVVVVQPVAGTFAAYSAECTHSGCSVNEVVDGAIVCPCHGSRFGIADGAVLDGPANRPLDPRQVTVTGPTITLT